MIPSICQKVQNWQLHCKMVFDLPATAPQSIIETPDPAHLPFKAPDIRAALHVFKENKASGPSCIPTQVVKHLHSSNNEVIL